MSLTQGASKGGMPAYSFFGDLASLDGEELGGLEEEDHGLGGLEDEPADDAFGALVEEVDIT